MRIFLDSSSFLKRYIEEAGSDSVEEICLNASTMALSIVCVPEVISALNRRLREHYISNQDYKTAKNRMFEEIEDISIINITPEVFLQSIQLLENNTLKSMDAIHIASALEWQPELFVSSDLRQIEAAKRAGLSVRYV